jgi:hypothetical protein
LTEEAPPGKPVWRRRWFKCVAILAAAYVAFPGAVRGMAEIDYARVKAKRKPIFTFTKAPMADGGSVEYGGVGYLVVDLHEYATPRPSWASTDGWAYDVGAELHYAIGWPWPWGRWIMRNKRCVKRVIHDQPPGKR